MRFFTESKRVCCLLILIICCAFFLTGCNKQRAKLSLGKAEKLLREAKDNNAEQNSKDSYTQATELVSGGYNDLNSGNAKEALNKAKSAVDLAKRTLSEAKQKNAIELESKAKDAIQIADKNFGQKENPEIYKKVREAYAAGEEKRKKEKYDASIKLYSQVITDVGTLLSKLENEAKKRQDDAKVKLGEMQKIGVRDYAPNYYVELVELLDEIEKLIKEQRDYVTAISRSESAIRKAEEGIERTKQKQSQEKIRIIETNLANAMTKGAPLYVPDLLEKCNENFDVMLKDYQDRKYDKILQIADSVTSQVTELLFLTKKASANDKIITVQKMISQAIEGGTKEYLPGRVEKVEDFLKQAEQKFAENKEASFEEVEQICLLAIDEDEKIRADFDALAAEAINSASESLEVSRSVFEKMAIIFMEKVSGSDETLDREFELGKQTLQEELRGYLDNATLAIQRALNKRKEQAFKDAIETSNNEVKKVAEEVLAQTYHVVAHNAMMELAAEVTHYEQEGAREYVPEELDRTKAYLDATKNLIRDAQYKQAVSKASETRAQLELTIQELIKKAVGDIEEAKKTIADSKNYQVEKYKPEDLKRSEKLLEDAKGFLSNRQIKMAVEVAGQSKKTTSSAISAASQMWAVEAVKTAETKIALAEEAGAQGYAGPTLDDAKKQFSTAQNLFKEGATNPASYVKSKEAADLAANLGEKALYFKIDNAETSINTAKNAGGWKYNPTALSRAIEIVKNSRNDIERKQYENSRKLADESKAIADNVIIESKAASFKERVGLIRKTLKTGYDLGINYFQTGKTKEITEKVNGLEKKYRIEDYEYINNELNKIEAELASIIEKTPEVFNNMLLAERARLEKLNTEFNAKTFAPQAVEDAQNFLKFSEIDFKKKKYSDSYENIKNAITSIDTIEVRYNEEIYAKKVSAAFSEMQGYMNGLAPILKLNPEVVYQLSKDPGSKAQIRSVSISGAITPQKFREQLDALYSQTAEITPPSTKTQFHKDVLVAINNARLAGIYFEKLIILDEFKSESVKEIVDKAYKFIEDAKGQQDRLQRILAAQAEASRVIRVENLPGWNTK